MGVTLLVATISWSLIAWLTPVAAAEDPSAAPAQAVEHTLTTTRKAILARAERLTASAEAAEALIRETIIPEIDTRATARFVLADRWQRASKDQRERFHNAFTRHVIATYGLLLHRFADEVVNALQRIRLRTETVRSGDRTALVRTFVRLDDKPERQARVYLHARDGQWLLFDAEYAGFSLLRIWRAEIQGRLRDESLDALIADLRARHPDEDGLIPNTD